MSNVPANVQAAMDNFMAKSTALSQAVASSLQDVNAAQLAVNAAAADLTSLLVASWPAPAPPPVVTPPPPPPAPTDPWDAIDKTGKTLVGDAFQKLLDAGHTTIPGGTYLVDPTKTILFYKNSTGALNPDGTPAVYLVAKTSPTPRDAIYDVKGAGIKVSGIHAVGDRMNPGAYTHPGVTSTDEWGYGAKVSGAGSTLENCYSSLCTGDGFGIVAPNVVILRCVANRNRRQGLSGFNCPGLKIVGGEFSETGTVTVDGITDPGAPNGPWAGIDIEPDKLASGVPNITVSITGVRLLRNKGSGVLGYLRSEVGGKLLINVRDCTFDGNVDGVRGEAVPGGVPGSVVINVMHNGFTRHRGAAVRANQGSVINAGSTSLADANTIAGASGPTTRNITKAGIVTPYDLKAYGTGKIVAGINIYD